MPTRIPDSGAISIRRASGMARCRWRRERPTGGGGHSSAFGEASTRPCAPAGRRPPHPTARGIQAVFCICEETKCPSPNGKSLSGSTCERLGRWQSKFERPFLFGGCTKEWQGSSGGRELHGLTKCYILKLQILWVDAIGFLCHAFAAKVPPCRWSLKFKEGRYAYGR